jgi:hypothetical protein
MSDVLRTVSVALVAICPFSIAQEYAEDFLRESEREHAFMRVPIRFLPPLFRHRVAMSFGVHYDVAEIGRKHDEIRLQWTAGTPFLPDFSGTVRFRIDGPNTRVLVDGAYRAPFGAAGGVFDALIGAYLARASIADLAQRIAAYLERRQAAWRAGLRDLEPA